MSTYYADDSVVHEYYPGVRDYIESLIKEANGQLFTASTFGDWCNVDKGMPQTLPAVKSCAADSPKLSQCGCNVAPNARHRPLVTAFYYIEQLEMVAELAAVRTVL
jgi:hypothetical protein